MVINLTPLCCHVTAESGILCHWWFSRRESARVAEEILLHNSVWSLPPISYLLHTTTSARWMTPYRVNSTDLQTIAQLTDCSLRYTVSYLARCTLFIYSERCFCLLWTVWACNACGAEEKSFSQLLYNIQMPTQKLSETTPTLVFWKVQCRKKKTQSAAADVAWNCTENESSRQRCPQNVKTWRNPKGVCGEVLERNTFSQREGKQ